MGTLSVPELGTKGNVADPKVKAAIEALNAILGTENKVKGSGIEKEAVGSEQLAAALKLGRWYKPSFVETEESRENTSFGTLATRDEVKEVIIPATSNALMLIAFSGNVKSSVAAAGSAAIFLGSEQLKVDSGLAEVPKVQEAGTISTTFHHFFTSSTGLARSTSSFWANDVTTGQIVGGEGGGGFCVVFAATGTYNVSVRYKATSGSITAKERKLWVGVLGV